MLLRMCSLKVSIGIMPDTFMHMTHKGEELKLLSWSAAKAYNQANYKDALDAMKLISVRVVEDFVS